MGLSMGWYMSSSGSVVDKNMVLRTIYINPALDDWLKQEAFSSRTSKNDLLRQYIEMGILAAAQTDASSPRKYAEVLDIVKDSNAAKVLAKLTKQVATSKKSGQSATKILHYTGGYTASVFGGAKRAAVKKATAKKAVKRVAKKAVKKVAAKRAGARRAATA
ncbi:hypothetical protein ACD588_11165 [Xanthomonas campestris pv. campestris]|jgi:hypothetical protein|uniref:hypothetical protein n=2 Tax=Xanthomonas campestris TaxID=339 RepID=UPI001C852EA0|nr:hypothetical protein [Xanthomonas campestris]MEA0925781.1 hypothetical protein [Xanthomonas campestris pv. campestris]MEB1488004.1 hypothetical protein [Xanthomonas campestris pv. campestris]MEB2025067.1 hypothetical protein [Xanthomonas campestris pv. campestris]WDJ78731.1 hypothetical protein JH282_10285 [Xanthomonas campestris pv. campestris]